MYCPECGEEVKEGSKFCKKCGTPINQENLKYNKSKDNVSNEKKTNKNVLIIAVAVIICVAIVAGAFISMNGNSTSSNNAVSESSNDQYTFGDYDVRIISGTSPSIGNDNPSNDYQDECNIITSTGEDDDYCFGASNYVSTEIIKGGKNSVQDVNVYTSWNVFVGKIEVTVTDANGETHKITKDIDESMQQSFDISVPSGCSINQIHCYVHN